MRRFGIQEHKAPWSVRGVSQEARAKAAEAAERRRMTIGEWVSEALVARADAELGGAAAAGGDSEAPSTAVETLLRHAEEDRDGGSAASGADGAGRSDQVLTELAERLVANERRNEERLAALANALSMLVGRLDDAGRAGGGVTGDDLDRSLKPIRAALDVLAGQAAGRRPVIDAANRGDAGEAADGDAASMPAGGERPAAAPPLKLDYDKLNRRAVENTKRYADDSAPKPKRGRLGRLFRSDEE